MKKYGVIFFAAIALLSVSSSHAQQDPLNIVLEAQNRASTYHAEQSANNSSNRAATQENAFGEMQRAQERVFNQNKTTLQASREKLRGALNLLKSVNRKFVR